MSRCYFHYISPSWAEMCVGISSCERPLVEWGRLPSDPTQTHACTLSGKPQIFVQLFHRFDSQQIWHHASMHVFPLGKNTLFKKSICEIKNTPCFLIIVHLNQLYRHLFLDHSRWKLRVLGPIKEVPMRWLKWQLMRIRIQPPGWQMDVCRDIEKDRSSSERFEGRGEMILACVKP